MFFAYPEDTNTFGLQLQYFYGDSILVAPVTQEDATSVDIYMPSDIFYDFWTHAPVTGAGATITVADLAWTDIPLFYKGGSIVPLRTNSANTTTMLRKQNFNLVIAPGHDGTASGMLYLDEGNNIAQPATSMINYHYADGVFTMTGNFGYDAGVSVEQITLLGVTGAAAASAPAVALKQGFAAPVHDAAASSLSYKLAVPLSKGASVKLH